MKIILKEPLLHFLLLGTALFVAYGWVSKRIGDEPGKIVITQGQIASTVEGFVGTMHRPPSSDELESLIRDRVREEVYYREALTLGLDRNDTIIRRRLRQKMEFVTSDIVADAEPTDAELSEYLKAHPDAFRDRQRITFSQVFLNPEKRGKNLAHDTAQLLAKLDHAGGTGEVSALGDAVLLDHTYRALPTSEVEKLFGKKFAAQVGELVPGRWHGPVESGYGVHLVFVNERTEGRLPALVEVRDAVRREWTTTRRLDANEKLYVAMLKRYVVTIERSRAVEEEMLPLAEAK